MTVEFGLVAGCTAGDRAVDVMADVRRTPVVARGEDREKVEPKTPVERYGRLRVCGTRLCDEAGTPVQLRGMSTHGIHWFGSCLVAGVLDALAEDWGSSVLRIAMYADRDGYQSNPKKFTDHVSRLIDMASARGMYVIVDWHWIDSGDPNHGLHHAKTFFREITERHGRKPNVIYEILNEAYQADWWMIKDYAEKVIPVIRAQDPDSVILVGTRGWSTLGLSEYGDEKEMVTDPVRASNIMYTYHFYAKAHRENFLRMLDRASSKLPVFVSEWGTQSWDGRGNDFAMSQRYVDLMARKRISWTNWSIADGGGNGDIFAKGACKGSRFAGTRVLTPAGVWIRQRVRG
ncbi:glycoside hydrolase family 5 protein [Streptomyces dysideae]|uniref:Cellulase n=1 Tax=Streptomyces dysideae TaxID=909626 RepID=A0A101UPP6_9ACTN|nr:glycoside hydrolase family 5 protein [Streptomyces dysideae]KUO14538.1 cellulase [Streptomyces dysideae]